MKKKKILFIINPISGGRNKDHIPGIIHHSLDTDKLEAEIVYSSGIGDAYELARSAAQNGIDIVVAGGGDGTVNEVASGISGSEAALGILPLGSGNGLSRFLGIPMVPGRAIRILNAGRTDRIDTATFNGREFFNVAGVGFDAHISLQFARSSTRGLTQYIRITAKEFYAYRPQKYRLLIDGRAYEREAMIVCFANSAQYGNNAYVSPLADIKDGLLDVCIIRPFSWYHFPFIAGRMFLRSLDRSAFVEIIQGKDIRVTREHEGAVHLDGEPLEMGRELEVRIRPSSLNVIVA